MTQTKDGQRISTFLSRAGRNPGYPRRYRWFFGPVLVGLCLLAAWQVAKPRQHAHGLPVSIQADGYDIQGQISPGESSSELWVILVHGNRAGGLEEPLYRDMAEGITDVASVLAIDMRGFGRSSNERLESSDHILDRSADISAAADYLLGNQGVDESQIVLVGHSLGALEVLRAARPRRYRAVISIGPADFRRFIGDPIALRSYSIKFGANTGISISPERIAEEGREFTPAALFSPCPSTPTYLVFGQFDLSESLRDVRDEVPVCDSMISWETIPLADHMYWTELNFVPTPLRSYVSRPEVGLLLSKVKSLLRSLSQG